MLNLKRLFVTNDEIAFSSVLSAPSNTQFLEKDFNDNYANVAVACSLYPSVYVNENGNLESSDELALRLQYSYYSQEESNHHTLIFDQNTEKEYDFTFIIDKQNKKIKYLDSLPDDQQIKGVNQLVKDALGQKTFLDTSSISANFLVLYLNFLYLHHQEETNQAANNPNVTLIKQMMSDLNDKNHSMFLSNHKNYDFDFSAMSREQDFNKGQMAYLTASLTGQIFNDDCGNITAPFQKVTETIAIDFAQNYDKVISFDIDKINDHYDYLATVS